MATLEQAVKFCENNWRIWQNLMFISLQNKKFWKFLMGIEKLTQLNHRQLIDEDILRKVN